MRSINRNVDVAVNQSYSRPAKYAHKGTSDVGQSYFPSISAILLHLKIKGVWPHFRVEKTTAAKFRITEIHTKLVYLFRAVLDRRSLERRRFIRNLIIYSELCWTVIVYCSNASSIFNLRNILSTLWLKHSIKAFHTTAYI